MSRIVRSFAPASIGNVAVGFDSLGLAFDEIGDIVEARVESDEGDSPVVIDAIDGLDDPISMEPEQNTASVAALSLLKEHPLSGTVHLKIQKGTPLSSGLGGSAASAVAAVMAVNHLLSEPLAKSDLLKHALAGEAISSGSAHADNIAPSLFGGLRLVLPESVFEIPLPSALHAVVVHPRIKIDTKKARNVLNETLPLKVHVEQSSYMAGFLAACFLEDFEKMREVFKDILIEPQRTPMIPGFKEAKEAALGAGALGFSISGAGPSVFALAESAEQAEQIGQAINVIFMQKNLSPAYWVSDLSGQGARILI